MIEVIVDKNKEIKTIAMIENGKLVETYEEDEESKKARNEGNIYAGIVKDIIPGMQVAFVDIGAEKNSFIHVKDIATKIDEKVEEKQELKIKDVTKVGERLLVQIQKDSNNKKGARISTHIKLTGKYIVLMPNTTILTISQKIENEQEKDRLINILKETLPENQGAIIRTAAEKVSKEEILKDLKRLQEEWNEILKRYEETALKAETLYKSPSIIEKIILDIQESKIARIIVNDKKEFEEIREKIKGSNIKVELEEKVNLIEKYDLERQIEKVKQRKIWLDCGGFITIDYTEALVAIDVNSGKFTGKTNLEDTIYKVNYEATIEIARQLRLRDIGGIIIIDYIDMNKKENKDKIERLLKETLKQDRAKTQVEGFTRLNLMEMTRKHICSHNS